MTLVEIVVTLAIVALASVLAIPAVGNLTHARLRGSARDLGQLVRQAFTMATLDGATWRLVLVPGQGSIVLERSEVEQRLAGGRAVTLRDDWQRLRQAAGLGETVGPDGAAVMGLRALFGETLDLAEPQPEAEPPEPADEGGQPAGGKKPAAARPPEGAGFARLAEGRAERSLATGVRVLDVWAEGMSAAALDGPVYLYFFPQGYTANALVHLEDTSHRPITVRVHGLTGRPEVLAGYVEPTL